MVDIERIREKLAIQDKTMQELADFVGVHLSTLYRKFENHGEGLSLKEASKIKQFLGLSKNEAEEIFFGLLVA
ncbi:hypothetical protein [Emergencia sp.]|uniref:hypothetical protein n=1 Tax=Emergencia sp. TaxID=1926557 RepID=UPI003AEF7958